MKALIWTHPKRGEGPEDWKRQFAKLRREGLDGVLPCVYTGAQALYTSRQAPVDAALLDGMLPVAEQEGLEVHAWVVALRCTSPQIRKAHPDWFSISRNGDSCLGKPPYVSHYYWLCPERPEVVAHLIRIVSELASYGELTGIHLDYIRHPDVILPEALRGRYDIVQDRELPEFDFCYCAVCREAFRNQEGVDPLGLGDPSANAAWERFRCESVRRVVGAAAQVTHAAGKTLSAAVFATPRLARAYVRQDWPQWDTDALLPMIYHPYYGKPPAWIEEATREGVEAISSGRSLYSGLFIAGLSPDELGQAVGYAQKGRADGVCLFCLGAMTDRHWAAFREALAAARA